MIEDLRIDLIENRKKTEDVLKVKYICRVSSHIVCVGIFNIFNILIIGFFKDTSNNDSYTLEYQINTCFELNCKLNAYQAKLENQVNQIHDSKYMIFLFRFHITKNV